jgi:hypothetical protein
MLPSLSSVVELHRALAIPISSKPCCLEPLVAPTHSTTSALGFEAVVALLFVQEAEAINPATNTTFKKSFFSCFQL